MASRQSGGMDSFERSMLAVLADIARVTWHEGVPDEPGSRIRALVAQAYEITRRRRASDV